MADSAAQSVLNWASGQTDSGGLCPKAVLNPVKLSAGFQRPVPLKTEAMSIAIPQFNVGFARIEIFSRSQGDVLDCAH